MRTAFHTSRPGSAPGTARVQEWAGRRNNPAPLAAGLLLCSGPARRARTGRRHPRSALSIASSTPPGARPAPGGNSARRSTPAVRAVCFRLGQREWPATITPHRSRPADLQSARRARAAAVVGVGHRRRPWRFSRWLAWPRPHDHSCPRRQAQDDPVVGSGRYPSTGAEEERARAHPERSFEAFHSACLSALVTDRAMEAWYHPPLHE